MKELISNINDKCHIQNRIENRIIPSHEAHLMCTYTSSGDNTTILTDELINKLFDMTSKRKIHIGARKGMRCQCFNCLGVGDTIVLNSEPWTNSYYCFYCNTLTRRIISDAMSGAHFDTLETYKFNEDLKYSRGYVEFDRESQIKEICKYCTEKL